MRIVALLNNEDKAYSWWRIISPFKTLRSNGVDANWCWLDSDDMPILSIKDSVVVLPRVLIKGGSDEYLKVWTERLRLAGATKLVYELDDDIVSDNYVQHMKDCGRASIVSLEQVEHERQRHIALMKLCDAVTVTTETLKSVVQHHIDKPIHVLPNYVDWNWFRSKLVENPPYQRDKNLVHIGIGGGLKPNYDYELLAKAWKYIDRKYKHVRFVIAGYQPNPLYEAVDFDKIIRVPAVSIDKWPASMQMDIGCAPLSDTSFNRCKSPIKAFEYIMADTLPITANMVYFESGLSSLPVATSENGWKYFLDYFVSNWLDKELHVKALQDQLLAKYNIYDPMNYGKWIEAYES